MFSKIPFFLIDDDWGLALWRNGHLNKKKSWVIHFCRASQFGDSLIGSSAPVFHHSQYGSIPRCLYDRTNHENWGKTKAFEPETTPDSAQNVCFNWAVPKFQKSHVPSKPAPMFKAPRRISAQDSTLHSTCSWLLKLVKLVSGDCLWGRWITTKDPRGFHSHEATPIAGWFIVENPSINGWWLGVPPWLRKPPCWWC